MNVTQRYRHDNGLCVACGSILGRGKWLCDNCMDRVNQERMQSRVMLHNLQMCTKCGKYKVAASERMCPECRAYHANYSSRYCAENVAEHRAKSNEACKRMRARRKAEGLCITCGSRGADDGYVTCQWCRKKNTQRTVAYNHRTGRVKKVYDKPPKERYVHVGE